MKNKLRVALSHFALPLVVLLTMALWRAVETRTNAREPESKNPPTPVPASQAYPLDQPAGPSASTKSAVPAQPHGQNTSDEIPSIPNKDYVHGMVPNERGNLVFLDRVSTLLMKPIRKEAEDMEVRSELQSAKRLETIAEYYRTRIPSSFHFVEELSRIKMTRFLMASIELSAGQNHRELDRALSGVLLFDLKSVGNIEVRRSLAGDIIQVLKAMRRIDPTRFEAFKSEAQRRRINVHFFDLRS